MDKLIKYFPDLSEKQLEQFRELKGHYVMWNEKVNLISRKDLDHFYLHHVLHSLTLSAFVPWNQACRVLDLGTGGGFPLIPLAIFYPEISFTGIDGTQKKIRVVQQIVETMKLTNVSALAIRAEDFKERFHFVVSRAVCSLGQLTYYANHLLLKKSVCPLPNGILAYKGGDLREELQAVMKDHYTEVWDIYSRFPEEYFKEKKLVFCQ